MWKKNSDLFVVTLSYGLPNFSRWTDEQRRFWRVLSLFQLLSLNFLSCAVFPQTLRKSHRLRVADSVVFCVTNLWHIYAASPHISSPNLEFSISYTSWIYVSRNFCKISILFCSRAVSFRYCLEFFCVPKRLPFLHTNESNKYVPDFRKLRKIWIFFYFSTLRNLYLHLVSWISFQIFELFSVIGSFLEYPWTDSVSGPQSGRAIRGQFPSNASFCALYIP